MKAPTPAPTFSQKSTVSQVDNFFSGKEIPLMHHFGSFHTYKVSLKKHTQTDDMRNKIQKEMGFANPLFIVGKEITQHSCSRSSRDVGGI